MQTEAEKRSSEARATSCNCTAHVVTETSFGGIRWCDSCELYCFPQALQFWNGPAFVVFTQGAAGEANYQEQ